MTSSSDIYRLWANLPIEIVGNTVSETESWFERDQEPWLHSHQQLKPRAQFSSCIQSLAVRCCRSWLFQLCICLSFAADARQQSMKSPPRRCLALSDPQLYYSSVRAFVSSVHERLDYCSLGGWSGPESVGRGEQTDALPLLVFIIISCLIPHHPLQHFWHVHYWAAGRTRFLHWHARTHTHRSEHKKSLKMPWH